MDDHKTTNQKTPHRNKTQGTGDRHLRDTVKSFETIDLSSLTQEMLPADAYVKVPVRPAKKIATLPVNNIAIAIQVDSQQAEETDPKSRISRGIPSWLTSLIIHLSLITSMALVSVSGGGRSMIDLIAATGDDATLNDVTEVDFELDSPELVSKTTENNILEDNVTETEQELSEMLDDSMVLTEMEADAENLFESVASANAGDLEMARQSATGGKTGANFFGLNSQGNRFVFIVDCSGSMAELGRWKRAKSELKKSVNGLTEDQQFLILLYNDGFIAMNEEMQLVRSTARVKRNAMRWLNRNRPDSWTFCAEALATALSLRPDGVFLLSDGEFNDRDDVFIVLDELNEKTKLQRLNRRQIPIHTVALGSHMGQFTMQQIAEETGGVFKLVD